jgi:Ca2+-binding RTX toxin-like protein
VHSAIRYRAAPGERNDVTLPGGAGGVLIRDEGAPLQPGRGCETVDEHTVRCRHEQDAVSFLTYVDLGDVADRFGATESTALVDGGSGDDALHGSRLTGGDGDDLLTGTGGQDGLHGAGGRDVLSAGAGNDTLSGGPGPDTLEGGDGVDLVTYEGRPEPLVVDLHDPGPDGAEGEGDTLSGFENVMGGAESDVLRGTDGPNDIEGGGVSNPNGDTIDGRGGDDELTGTKALDRIAGGSGDDEIWGVRGPDRLSGGAGDDRIDLYNQGRAGADRVSCGSGADDVWLPDPLDAIGSDCELVTTAGFHSLSALPRRGGGAITFRFVRDRPPDASFIRCGLIELGPGGSFGRLRFTAPRRGTKYLRVPLTARGRRADRPGARIRLRFTAFLTCPGRASDTGGQGGYTLRR